MENKSFLPASFKQGMELMRVVELAFSKANPTQDQVNNFIKDPSLIYEMVGKLFEKNLNQSKEVREIFAIWQKIYHEWFGIEIDVSGLQVPEIYNSEKHFLVLVAKGITMNTVVEAMKKRFNVYLYTEDLDVSVTKNDRTPENGTYLVFFNRNIEADEEFKNMSADNLAKKGHQGITLLERLLLEIFYYNETNKHLDVKNITLCSGSRVSGGGVPCVCWYSGRGKLCVAWFHSDCSYGALRSRVVVS